MSVDIPTDSLYTLGQEGPHMRTIKQFSLALVLTAAFALLLAAAASARCLDLDDDCRLPPATATWLPLWTATPPALIVLDVAPEMSTDIPLPPATSAPAQAAASATWTPIPCPIDWSLPYSEANYQQLAWCRWLYYIDTGEIVCPPEDTVWINWFRDAFCAPPPGATALPPPPWWQTPTP